MKKISVCIPTYNGARFLRQAINSVLEQTFPPFELIIVDDASADDSFEIASSYQDQRIKCFQNPERLGLVGNWNRCIELASGEYLYIFHQDDVMQPGNLEKKINRLDADQKISFVFSDILTIDESGDVLGGHWNPGLKGIDRNFRGPEFFEYLLERGNFVPCQAVMLRAKVIQQAGRFDKRLRYTPDYEMWLRLSLTGDVFYVDEPLVMLRRHIHQETNLFLGKAIEVEEVWKTIEIIFTEHNHKISQPEKSYHKAIQQLINWTNQLLRINLKQFRFRRSLKLAALLLEFIHLREMKLPYLQSRLPII